MLVTAKPRNSSTTVISQPVENPLKHTIKIALTCLLVLSGIFILLASLRVVPSTENFLSRGITGKVMGSLSICIGSLLFIIACIQRCMALDSQFRKDQLAQMDADIQAKIEILTHENAELQKKLSTIEAFIFRNPELRATCETFKARNKDSVANIPEPKKDKFDMNAPIDRWTYLRLENNYLNFTLREIELFFERHTAVRECYQKTLESLRADPSFKKESFG